MSLASRLFSQCNFKIFSRLKLQVSVYQSQVPHKRLHTSKILRFPIQSVAVLKSKQLVQVTLENGQEEFYPWIFLQDNCTCDQCFDSASKSRKKKMTNLDLSASVLQAEIVKPENKNDKQANNDDSNSLKLVWSNGHEGTFSDSWLLQRSFSKKNRNFRRKGLRDDPQLVDSQYKMTKRPFDEVLGDESKLLLSLQELCKFGVTMLLKAPKDVGQLRRLADSIGFVRTTHYGNEFTVRSIPNASNLAYTSTTLNVHTDLPYYVYPPGVQILHCIKQFYGEQDAKVGGESHLVDGFLVAQHMKLHFPQEYQSLCEISVEFMDIGKDFTEFNKVHHSPHFVLCPETGNLTRIVYSNQQLSSYMPIELEKVEPLYKALKTFTDLCYDDKFLMRFKLNEGEVLLFDNWRFLHGRSEFDQLKGERHLEGCYIDWDEVFSKIRVITNSDVGEIKG